MKKIITFSILQIALISSAQKVYTHIALINATAHIGNGKVIENSLIVINKDKI